MTEPALALPARTRVRRLLGSHDCDEHGSALVLVPVAVLVLVVLASIAVDSAAVFLGQRQLVTVAEDAATDAVSAVSEPAFYTRGVITIDPVAAQRVVTASVAAQGMSGVRLTQPPTVQVAGRQVCVTLVGQVTRIFGLAIPGIPAHATVTGRATATAAGDTGARVPKRQLC